MHQQRLVPKAFPRRKLTAFPANVSPQLTQGVFFAACVVILSFFLSQVCRTASAPAHKHALSLPDLLFNTLDRPSHIVIVDGIPTSFYPSTFATLSAFHVAADMLCRQRGRLALRGAERSHTAHAAWRGQRC